MANTVRIRGLSRVLAALTASGVFCAMAAVWWLAQRPVATLEAADAALESAIARIEAESETGRSAPQAAAPPALRPQGEPPGNPATAGASPSAGYSITAFHGEMARAPMDPQDYGPEVNVAVEHPWLASPAALVRQSAETGRDWTFGWLGFHRAATPLELKMPPTFAGEALSRPPWQRVPVLVTLMDDDPDGRWRQALTDLGGVVDVFDPAIRVYPAVLPYAAVHGVAAADFVLAVEPVRRVSPANDSAVPALGADALRLYDEGTFSGIGGATVPVRIMDTGLNVHHEAIGTGRRSICGGNFAAGLSTSPRAADEDLWFDFGLHGTHVTGTLLGNPRGRGREP